MTINPAGGLFTNYVNVSLSTTVNNAVIRYTLDNSDPTANSTPYTGSFRFTTNTTVKAQAYVNGFPVSDLLTATYSITNVATPLPPGAVSWWPGNGYALDVVGGNDGILTNGASFGPGKVGQGFQLDGLKASVLVPDAPSLNFGPGADFSMEAWIKVNARVANGLSIIDKRLAPNIVDGVQYGGGVGYALFLGGGHLAMQLGPGPLHAYNHSDFYSPGPDLRDGQFHHVAATVERNSGTGGKLYVDGQVVLTFNPTRAAGDLSNAEPFCIGRHTLSDPTYDSYFGGIIDEVTLYKRALSGDEIKSIFDAGTQGKALPGNATTNAYVMRKLPVVYAAGAPLTVTLHATPPTNASVYVVQDQPPLSWTVSKISDDGAFDATNRLVKFGPFLDAQARTLTYVLTPPPGEATVGFFTGKVSIDGGERFIGGDQFLAPANLHPADNNPPDWRIEIGEMTAYSAAWKRGDIWPSGPVPIPITYVSRAAFLWKGGEYYRYDSNVSTAPLYWVNSPRPASLGAVRRPGGKALASTPGNQATAATSGRYQAGQPLIVSIEAKPGSGVAVYAVEDQPPAGWTATPVSSDGVYDAATQKVKWGPFFDNTARTLSYQVKPPNGATGPVAFSGLASFDGANVNIAGVRQADWGGSALPRLSVARDSAGTEIVFTGNPGQMYRLEYSPDLLNWQRLDPILGTNGPSAYLDANLSVRPAAFYRLVPW